MTKTMLPLKGTFRLDFVGLLLLLSFASWTCKEQFSGPSQISDAGITGVVYDTAGHRLDSVRIFCLYNFSYYPPVNTMGKSVVFRITKPDTFGFSLYQNYPNPVQNSTYLRFSLPIACTINLSIADRANGRVRFAHSDTLRDGLYQLYLNYLVDSLQLQNGPYTYTLRARSTTGAIYNDSKEMFVVSDAGSPNATTGYDGVYAFNYGEAFVGDSVAVYTHESYPIYNVGLGKDVVLLFKRRGYYPLYHQAFLNPTIQVHSDIVMARSGQ